MATHPLTLGNWKASLRIARAGATTAAPVAATALRTTHADGRRGAPAPRSSGWLDRLDRWRSVARQRAAEAYVAEATSVHDVEARLRLRERAVPHPYY